MFRGRSYEPSDFRWGFLLYQLFAFGVPVGAWFWLMNFLHQSNLDDPHIGPKYADLATGFFGIASAVLAGVPMLVCWLVGSLIAAIVIAAGSGFLRSLAWGLGLGVLTVAVEAGILYFIFIF